MQIEPSLISIVVPVFNEMEVIEAFNSTLLTLLDQEKYRYEVIYIDDGSYDDSFQILKAIKTLNPNISVIKFSRNFGKELAVSAGLQKSAGDAVIVIDCDLQDPPDLIPSMIKAWEAGNDVVNMRRVGREGDSFVKKQTAKYFYKLIKSIGDVEIEENVGDFRLLSRKAVDAINQLPERNRFMKGIFSWVGYKKTTIDYVRKPRLAGKTKWPYWKLWNFALDGITNFSTAPLKISAYIGFIFAFISFFLGLSYFIKTIIYGDEVKGFPTLFLTILFLGGIQLISIGVIGEYISRIFIEIKARPLFLIDEYLEKSNQASNQK